MRSRLSTSSCSCALAALSCVRSSAWLRAAGASASLRASARRSAQGGGAAAAGRARHRQAPPCTLLLADALAAALRIVLLWCLISQGRP